MPSHTIILDEARTLHLLTQGEGPAILLVHGAISTHADWLGGPFEALSRLGCAIAVDRPGHGLSRRPRLAGSPRDQARQIEEGVRRLGVSHAVVVGHSFGALVSLALAEQAGDFVRGLVLVSPVGFPEFRPLEQALFGPRAWPVAGPVLSELAARTLDRPLLEQAHRLMFWPRAIDENWRRHYDWDWMQNGAAGVANGEDALALSPWSPESRRDFGRIDVPVHIFAGERDLIANPAFHAGRLDAALPRSTLEMVADEGHMLHRQHPEKIAAAAASLLEPVAA